LLSPAGRYAKYRVFAAWKAPDVFDETPIGFGIAGMKTLCIPSMKMKHLDAQFQTGRYALDNLAVMNG
jgi:hypothetical protein